VFGADQGTPELCGSKRTQNDRDVDAPSERITGDLYDS
jgi:hypothetical protein